VTGGLGPTQDDVTKPTIASYFKTELIRNQAVLTHVEGLFARLLGKGEMPARNYAQADVLANCEVLFNDVGTAPGMWIDQGGVSYVFLPGVPFEMKFLMEQRVLPKLAVLHGDEKLYHEHLLTVGLGESYLADMIADIEAELPDYIKLAYLPKIGLVRLRLSAHGVDYAFIKEQTVHFANRIADRLQAIVHKFTQSGLKLATAESCTGGAIASRITQVSGASQVFDCGIVAYHNRIKEQVLGVESGVLQEFGAVSEQTVRQMAEGVKRLSGAHYGIATSGIAGPSGGTVDKPVGMVWIAIAGKYETHVRCFQFANNREINIERSTMQALILLWRIYQKENQA
jgi:nicotinamide-nucleotide amidase